MLKTLKNAPPNATVSEITASFDNPTWQALIQEALERDPQFLRKIRLFGEVESTKALAKLAGGENATEVRKILENAKTALTQTTSPQREAALTRANLGKIVAELESLSGKLSAEATSEVQKVRDLIKAGKLAQASARLDLIKRGLPVGAQKYTYKNELAEKAKDCLVLCASFIESNSVPVRLPLTRNHKFLSAPLFMCNFACGAVVPIPTLPSFVIVILGLVGLSEFVVETAKFKLP